MAVLVLLLVLQLIQFGTAVDPSSLLQPAPVAVDALGAVSSVVSCASAATGTWNGTTPFDSTRSMLTLRGGVVAAVPNGYLSVPQTCIVVLRPVNAVAPRVSIAGAVNLGICDNITLDGGGTVDLSGRPVVLAWGLVPLNDAANSSLIASAPSLAPYVVGTVLSIDPSLLGPGCQFAVTLSAPSFLNATATATVTVVIGSSAIPNVVIVGPPLVTVSANRRISLQAVGSQTRSATCAAPSEPLTFRWSLLGVGTVPALTDANYTVTPDTLLPLSRFSSKDPTALSVPSWAFAVGGRYIFGVRVAYARNDTVFNTASVTVDVVSAGVAAAIAGGDRVVGSAVPLLLSASQSVDYDNVTDDTFVFAWTCDTIMQSSLSGSSIDTLSPGCVDVYSAPVSLPDDDIVRLDAGILPAGAYRFTVTVAKGVIGGLIPWHYRSASSSVTITVVNGSPPVITTTAAAVTVIPQQRFTIGAVVTSASLATPVLAWSAPGLSDAHFTAALRSPSLAQPSLALTATMPSGVYPFVLTASVGSSSAASTVVVTVVSPPRNGYVAVSPASGAALTTQFAVSALAWSGEAEVLGA